MLYLALAGQVDCIVGMVSCQLPSGCILYICKAAHLFSAYKTNEQNMHSMHSLLYNIPYAFVIATIVFPNKHAAVLVKCAV